METTWLTITQAANWLQVHPNTVAKLIKEMEGADMDGIYRSGTCVRINQADMNRFLRTRRAKGSR